MCPCTTPRPSAAFQPAAFDFDYWETEIIRLTHHVDPHTRAIGIPRGDAVSFAADVAHDGVKLPEGVCNYGAYGNVSWTAFEKVIAGIEDGIDALGTPRGRDANAMAFRLVPAGSHIIVACEDLYPGTRKLLADLAVESLLQVTYTSSDPAALEAARQPNTRMVYCEPLTNPHLDVTNLKAIVDFARQHSLISVADNTLTPLICRPLRLGFDIVTASATKYISGQNDTLGGYIAVSKNRAPLATQLRDKRNNGSGSTMSPDTARTLTEQVRSLPSRFATQCRNATALADYLASQQEVVRVYYPGYNDAASDQLAKTQFSGFGGGVLSFEFKEGVDIPAFLNAFKGSNLVETGDSLGADITLMNWYSEQSNWVKKMSHEDREANRFPRGFVRVAAGRGGVAQLVGEFEHAFAAARESMPRLGPANETLRREERPALAIH